MGKVSGVYPASVNEGDEVLAFDWTAQGPKADLRFSNVVV